MRLNARIGKMYKNILYYKYGNIQVKLTIKDIITLSEYITLLLNESIPFTLRIEVINDL